MQSDEDFAYDDARDSYEFLFEHIHLHNHHHAHFFAKSDEDASPRHDTHIMPRPGNVLKHVSDQEAKIAVLSQLRETVHYIASRKLRSSAISDLLEKSVIPLLKFEDPEYRPPAICEPDVSPSSIEPS